MTPALSRSTNRFEPGSHGGCEAHLFEFRETRSPDSNTVRIAAVSPSDALAYLRWHDPDFQVGTVENLGLILLVSGSPVD